METLHVQLTKLAVLEHEKKKLYETKRAELIEIDAEIKTIRDKIKQLKTHGTLEDEIKLFTIFLQHMRIEGRKYIDDKGRINASLLLHGIKQLDHTYNVTPNLMTKFLKKAGIIEPIARQLKTNVGSNKYMFYLTNGLLNIDSFNLNDDEIKEITKDFDTYSLLPFRRDESINKQVRF